MLESIQREKLKKLITITREEYIRQRKLRKKYKFHRKRLEIKAHHQAIHAYNKQLDKYHRKKHLLRYKRSFTTWGEIENFGYDIRILIYLGIVILLIMGILMMTILLLNDLNKTSICVIAIVLILVCKLFNETK